MVRKLTPACTAVPGKPCTSGCKATDITCGDKTYCSISRFVAEENGSSGLAVAEHSDFRPESQRLGTANGEESIGRHTSSRRLFHLVPFSERNVNDIRLWVDLQ
jgi:hypothetical protein